MNGAGLSWNGETSNCPYEHGDTDGPGYRHSHFITAAATWRQKPSLAARPEIVVNTSVSGL